MSWDEPAAWALKLAFALHAIDIMSSQFTVLTDTEKEEFLEGL